MKKFIFEEKFILMLMLKSMMRMKKMSLIENGNYQYYDISDFTDDIEVMN